MGDLRGDDCEAAGDIAGKIAGLVALLSDKQVCDAVEADFQATYGLPLAPGVDYTWRKFSTLLWALGGDSRFYGVLGRNVDHDDDAPPPDISRWDKTDQLLAIIVDQLIAANWQRAGGGGGGPKFAFAGQGEKKKKQVLSQSEVVSLLSKIGGTDRG